MYYDGGSRLTLLLPTTTTNQAFPTVVAILVRASPRCCLLVQKPVPERPLREPINATRPARTDSKPQVANLTSLAHVFLGPSCPSQFHLHLYGYGVRNGPGASLGALTIRTHLYYVCTQAAEMRGSSTCLVSSPTRRWQRPWGVL